APVSLVAPGTAGGRRMGAGPCPICSPGPAGAQPRRGVQPSGSAVVSGKSEQVMLRDYYALTPMKSMKLSLLPPAVSPLLLGGVAHAEDDGHSYLRVHFSKSSETDFVTVVVGDY